MEPITIKPILYVLELEHKKYYVGITYNLNLRYAQHMTGNGSKWTKLHKPIRIKKVIAEANMDLERMVTIHYMKKFGYQNVRGSCYSKIIMNKPPKELLDNPLHL